MIRSFNVLDPHLDTTGSLFIEASAGTGKTFAIEHLVIRSLFEASAHRLSDLLLVTFTKKSQRDMKQRVLMQLMDIHQSLRRGDWKKLPEYLIPMLQHDENHVQNTVETALTAIDQLNVFTIHGYCHRVLQRYYQHIDPESDPLELCSVSAKESCIVRFLNDTQHQHPVIDYAIESVYQNKLDFLFDDVLSHDHHQHSLSEDLNALNALFDQYQSNDHWQRLITTDHSWFSSFLGCKNRAGQVKGLQRRRIVDFHDMLLSRKPRLSRIKWFWDQFVTGDKRKKNSNLDPDVARMLDYFNTYSTHINRLTNRESVRDFMSECAQGYIQQYLEATRQITYDQLIKRVYLLCEDQDFVGFADSEFKKVIIDEFQDTDAYQWSIFKRLYFDRSIPVVLVGDPKQSIYRFRGADLYTYMDAKSQLNTDSHFTLNTNYRSKTSLIYGLNHIFSNNGHRPLMHLPKDNTTFSIDHVLAPKKHTGDHSITLQPFDTGGVGIDMMRDILSEWNNTVLQHQKDGSNTAILVRDKHQEMVVGELLDGLNIAYRHYRKKRFVDSSAVLCATLLIQCVCSNRRQSYLRLFAQSKLGRLFYSDDIGVVYSLVERLQKYYQRYGFQKTYTSLLNSKLNRGELFYNLVNGDNLFFNEFDQIMRRLITESQQRGILRALQDMYDYPDSEYYTFEPMVSHGIILSTIHASKGLEYDHVLPIGVMKRSHGKHIRDDDDIFENDAEQMRLFYVGLTRAKKSLFIPVPSPESTVSQTKQASMIEHYVNHYQNGLIGFWDAIHQSEHFIIGNKSQSIETDNQCDDVIDQTGNEVPLLSSSQAYQLPATSFSALQVHNIDHSYPSDAPASSFPRGTESGLIIHDLMEQLFNRRLFDHCDSRVHTLINERLKKTNLDSYCDQIKTMIDNILANGLMISQHHINWSLFDKCLTETEFLHVDQSKKQLIHGFVDLILRHNNTIYILDWKSHDLNAMNIDQDQLHQFVLDQGYGLQASLYMNALQSRVDNRYVIGGFIFYFVRSQQYVVLNKNGEVL
jgi:exodeoxyribonuclease V beta subunit